MTTIDYECGTGKDIVVEDRVLNSLPYAADGSHSEMRLFKDF